MIVDTSATVAVLKREAGYEKTLDLLLTREAAIPAPVLVETRIAVSSALGAAGRRRLESLLTQSGVDVAEFGREHADVALKRTKTMARDPVIRRN